MTDNMRDIILRFSQQVKMIMGSKLDKVILYGSYARGDYNEHSDVDIIQNVRRLQEDMKMRYYDAPDLKDVGNNAYRFINAVSDFATHAEPLRKTKNYRENMFSRTIDGNPLIDRAYQMVCA